MKSHEDSITAFSSLIHTWKCTLLEHTDQEIDMIGNYGFCMADMGQLYSSYSILSRYAIPNVLETENLFLTQKRRNTQKTKKTKATMATSKRTGI